MIENEKCKGCGYDIEAFYERKSERQTTKFIKRTNFKTYTPPLENENTYWNDEVTCPKCGTITVFECANW